MVREDQGVGVILDRDDDDDNKEIEQRIALPGLENKSEALAQVRDGEREVELTPKLLIGWKGKMRREKERERQEDCGDKDEMLEDHCEKYMKELRRARQGGLERQDRQFDCNINEEIE
jgi:hypothetical protein